MSVFKITNVKFKIVSIFGDNMGVDSDFDYYLANIKTNEKKLRQYFKVNNKIEILYTFDDIENIDNNSIAKPCIIVLISTNNNVMEAYYFYK
jgi:hypothetical protein